jgi:membrane fusion protein, multidrug efflux system
VKRSTRSCGWALAIAVIAGGCHDAEHGEAPPRFEVTTPLRDDIELTREYVGQVRAIQHIEVRALERGYLEHIAIDEGQRLSEGQLMFQIMPAVYRAELARSQAEADYAQIELGNTLSLRDGGVVSEQEVSLARARLRQATAERQLANTHLGFTSIRAPFDGLSGRLEVRRGSLVDEGELLTVLSDNHEMWVYFNVSEAEYLGYQSSHEAGERRAVRLRMANGEIFDQPGVIQTIEADFDSETGTIAFRAGFPNPNGLLRHGETGQVAMTTRLEDVLVVPQLAAFDVLDKTFVFVVDAEGVVRQREIQISEALPHLYVVSAGLTERDRILLEGLRRVHDGDHVRAVDRDPSEVRAELDVPAE